MHSIERAEKDTAIHAAPLGLKTLPHSADREIVEALQRVVKTMFIQARASQWPELNKSLALYSETAATHQELHVYQINTAEKNTGLTLLSVLANQGAPATTIDKILQLGASLTITVSAKVEGDRRSGLTPLHLALGNRHLETALQLLRHGHAIESVDSQGETPLHIFLANRSKKIPEERVCSVIKMAIHFGAEFSVTSKSGSLILQDVLRHNYFEAAALLSDHMKAQAVESKHVSFTTAQMQEVAYELILHPTTRNESLKRILENLNSLSVFSKANGPDSNSLVQEKLSDILKNGLANSDKHFWDGFTQILSRLHQSSVLFNKDVVAATVNTPVVQDRYSSIPLLHQALRIEAPEKIIKLLIAIGADVNVKARVGSAHFESLGLIVQQSPLYIAIEKQNYRIAEALINAGAIIPEQNDEDFFIREMPRFFHKGNLECIKEIILSPRIAQHFFGAAEVRECILQHYTEFSPKILIWLALRCPRISNEASVSAEHAPTSEQMVERVTKSLGLTSDTPWLGGRLIEYCTKNLFLAEAAALIQSGVEIPAIYLEGRSADDYSSEELANLRGRLIADFIFVLFDSEIFNNRSVQISRKLLLELLAFDLDYLGTKYQETKNYLRIDDPNSSLIEGFNLPGDHSIPEMVLLHFPFDKFFGKGKSYTNKETLFTLCKDILKQDGNIQDAALYLKVIIPSQQEDDGIGRPLAVLFNRLMFRYPMNLIGSIALAIEYSGFERSRRVANLVELFAFIRHPKLGEDQEQTIEKITAAISSVPYFINYGLQVTGLMVNCWYDIANISLGFKRYRYPTKRGYSVDDSGRKLVEQESVFEAFGGKRINSVSPKHPFQVGYEFIGKVQNKNPSYADWSLDPDTIITFFRGGVAIAKLGHGIHFIRNSSLVFGRDLLKYPAYFKSIAGFGTGDEQKQNVIKYIRSLTPEIIEKQFINIMNVELYGNVSRRSRREKPQPSSSVSTSLSGIEHIRVLLDTYKVFEDSFRRFQFDTQLESAWQEDAEGNDKLVGACSSAGFSNAVAGLRREHDDAYEDALLNGKEFTAATVLELHSQAYPPFSPYARLVVDSDVLKTLEYLAINGWNPESSLQNSEAEELELEVDEDQDLNEDLVEEFYLNSGVLQFFQTALSTQSELIVVPFNGR